MLIAIAIFFGLVPSFTWLIFFLNEDTKPEPKRMILHAFFAGAAFIPLVYIILKIFEIWVHQLGAPTIFLDQVRVAPTTLLDVVILFGLAFFEEGYKFLIVYLGVRRTPDFDQPVDVMIYLIIAALGFAAVENVAANFSTLQYTTSVGAIFQTTVIRSIGATLLHALASATVGYYWARGILAGTPKRFIAFGLFIATGLHTVFNYLIIVSGTQFFPTIFLVFVAFFIFVDFEKLKRIDTLPVSVQN